MLSVFKDGVEYTKRLYSPFKPTQVTLAEIHYVVPQHLHRKDTHKGLYYVFRDIFFAVLVFKLGLMIEPFSMSMVDRSLTVGVVSKWCFWTLYWYCQGIILGGWWCLAHEAGHGNLSSYKWVNNLIGYTLHTVILVPYYSWRSTHRNHHKALMSVERDENFVPRTRSDYRLPPEYAARFSDYHDVFEETPIYTVGRMLFMQLIGWQCYLLTNVMGNPMYPPGTNHFQPSSALFKRSERDGIVASNIGLCVMLCVLYLWTKEVGLSYFFKLYFIPYLLANHWIVMLTYLHHSDPTIPHYRGKQWSFLRGALSTVDRPLLGWVGRFFFHNVSHDHVAHHLFSSIPFCMYPLNDYLRMEC